MGRVGPSPSPTWVISPRPSAWSAFAAARPRFRWITQRDDIDAVIAATRHWPETGPGLERIDLPALQTRWQARRLRDDPPPGLD